jgi:hypothetical protein
MDNYRKVIPFPKNYLRILDREEERINLINVKVFQDRFETDDNEVIKGYLLEAILSDTISILDTDMEDYKVMCDDHLYVYIPSEESFIYVPDWTMKEIFEYYTMKEIKDHDELIDIVLHLISIKHIIVIHTNIPQLKAFQNRFYRPQ